MKLIKFFFRSIKKGTYLLGILLLFIFLSPFLSIIALLIRIKLGHPVFFQQVRAGINGKPFVIYKFRTMLSQLTDAEGNTLSEAQRMTQFGNFLRKTSMDELPQIINLLKGDMAIVGPRPLLMDYISLYDEEQLSRLDVKPGITGWAQVNGRNAISWNEKFKFDIWYVKHKSIALDLKIILLTLNKVLSGKDVNQDKNTTMDRFLGNQSLNVRRTENDK